MKNIIKYTLVAASAFLAVSCGDDFLEKESSEFLTTEQIADAASRNPDVVAGTMNGIYALMFATETGGTTGDDDFGQKGYDIFSDFLTSDVALSVSTYGWYRTSLTEYGCTQDFTNLDNYQVWRYYYRIIRSANTVIDALGGNDVTPELEENKFIMGQAKAIRAHSYFYLAQYFQKSYNPSEEILPIYSDLLTLNGPKVAASEIYALIESDLTTSITLLDGFTRTAKSQINQDVAKGILAYVYAAMGNSQEVKTLTEDIINGGMFTLMSETEVLGGFNDVATSGWMWGVDLTIDNEISLVSWWGQMDYFSYSYAGYGDSKAIDAGLYSKIPDDDVRKQQFESDPEAGNQYLQPLNKFYEAERVPLGSSQTIVSDLIYMRIAEMYILNAEASAKLGDDANARASLKILVSERVPDASYIDGLSGTQLSNEIYLQSRIELWGEGKTYLALKRNQKTTTRGDNHLSYIGETLSYDDEKLTFEIPESEIQNNPFINSQNN